MACAKLVTSFNNSYLGFFLNEKRLQNMMQFYSWDHLWTFIYLANQLIQPGVLCGSVEYWGTGLLLVLNWGYWSGHTVKTLFLPLPFAPCSPSSWASVRKRCHTTSLEGMALRKQCWRGTCCAPDLALSILWRPLTEHFMLLRTLRLSHGVGRAWPWRGRHRGVCWRRKVLLRTWPITL